MHINSNALLNLIWRLKPTIDPASRLLLVGLFFSVFTSSHFVDPRFKTQPQHAANPNVEDQPAEPAIVFVRAGWDSLKIASLPTDAEIVPEWDAFLLRLGASPAKRD